MSYPILITNYNDGTLFVVVAPDFSSISMFIKKNRKTYYGFVRDTDPAFNPMYVYYQLETLSQKNKTLEGKLSSSKLVSGVKRQIPSSAMGPPAKRLRRSTMPPPAAATLSQSIPEYARIYDLKTHTIKCIPIRVITKEESVEFMGHVGISTGLYTGANLLRALNPTAYRA